ncbi:MAG: LysR family transcriptional regulator [Pseudomonadaceae bacterium]|nr:LysR family transcriptional regulator [Pseudomonadaceae bacterium]
MSLTTTRLPETRKLRHVVAVARAGSFTGATQLLAITQSALTKSIADMEAQLGYPLFERLPRGVRLTQAGEHFVQRAERLLSEMTDLMTEMQEIADLKSGRLRLGVGPAAFMAFLDDSIPTFAQNYPGIEIEISTGTVDEMARAVINRDVDICFGAANYLKLWHELETATLGPLQTFFIGRKDHPAGVNPSAANLLQYPVILPATGLSTEVNLAGAYRAAGLATRAPHYICDHFPVILELVAKTDAISPVVTLGPPGRRLRSGYSIYEDIVELEQHDLGYAVSSRDVLSPPAAVFCDLFLSQLSSGRQLVV